jgi:hypothetical protein
MMDLNDDKSTRVPLLQETQVLGRDIVEGKNSHDDPLEVEKERKKGSREFKPWKMKSILVYKNIQTSESEQSDDRRSPII